MNIIIMAMLKSAALLSGWFLVNISCQNKPLVPSCKTTVGNLK
ncbi:hypothetical protein Pcac1_g22122 [Phytophthora cactorum]|nr:hypothetical protein Pcac1_g22122 [Phytophthora cactorum]